MKYRKVYIVAAAIGCVLIGFLPFVANAGVWGEDVRMTDGKPHLIKMATTYIPHYLSREGNGNGTFGRFRFGEKIDGVRGERIPAVDGTRQALIVQYNMNEKEYRHFKNAKLFFDEERRRLYKIVAEQTFPTESLARDRMETINRIIEDCKQGYGISLVRTVVEDGRIVYEGSDEVIVITLEVCKQSEGNKRLLFTVMNKKIQQGEDDLLDSGKTTDSVDYVEVQI